MAFIFDANSGETPESIARQREIAAMLMGQGNLVAPRNTMDGIGNAFASIAGGIASGAWNRKADEAEKAGRGGANDLFQQLVGGITNGTPITGSPASPGAQPTSAPAQGGDMSAFQNAISGIESGGRYDAVGPTHPQLGRALGKYQVMEANVGPWSKAALGREVSPQEFLANPQIQDAVFNSQFGQYVKQFGSPDKAAQAWFAGPGGVGTNRQDSLGTSVPEYAAKFNAALGQGDQAQMPPGAQPTQGGAPQQPPQMQGGPGMQQIMQVLSNPWSTPQQRAVAEMLLKQQMEAQDPARKLDMDYRRAQVDKMNREAANPAGDESFYGNPVAVQNPDGSIGYGQMGNRGTFKPVQLGEGQKFAPPTRTIDAGTETILVDQAGNVISRQPKNSFQPAYDAASGRAQGEAAGSAQASASADIQAGQNALDVLAQIREHPGRGIGTGFSSYGNEIRGTSGKDFQNIVDQAKSGAFLTAIQQMRGLGALSNAEGQAATAAITRMDTATSEEAFMAALSDYEKIVTQGMERARTRLPQGTAPQNGAGQPTTDYRSKYGLE
jgi:hypothetical protein